MTDSTKKKPRGRPFKSGDDERRRVPAEAGRTYKAGDACPKCASEGRSGTLQIRKGQYGDFLGCDAFPLCRFSRALPKDVIPTVDGDATDAPSTDTKGKSGEQKADGAEGEQKGEHEGEQKDSEQGEGQKPKPQSGDKPAPSVKAAVQERQQQDNAKEQDEQKGKPQSMDNVLDDRIRRIAREEDVKVAEAVDKSVTALRGEMQKLAEQAAKSVKPKTTVVELPPAAEGEANVKADSKGDDVVARILRAFQCGRPVLLVGPAGSGKTTYARIVAEILFGEQWESRFGTLSCTSGMTETHISGRSIPLVHGEGGVLYMQSEAVRIGEAGGVFLFDELDAADPNVLLVLNQLFSHGVLPLPQRPELPYMKRHERAYFMGAANTVGSGATRLYAGRNQLDAAFIDRFDVIQVDYSRTFEATVAEEAVCKQWWAMRECADRLGLRVVLSTRGLQRVAASIKQGLTQKAAIAEELTRYPQDVAAKLLTARAA